MKYSLGIVAHYSRQKMVEKLSNSVCPNIVAMDQGDVGCELNHIVAWEELQEFDSEWDVVLEDDAIVIKDFREQLQQVLAKSPTPVVSLYLGRSRPPHWQGSIAQTIGLGTSFIIGQELLNCVGVCIRRDYSTSMARWVRNRWEQEMWRINHDWMKITDRTPIDEMISDWARESGVKVSYTNPSIVDHADTPTTLDFHPSKYKEADMSSRSEVRTAWRVGARKSWDDTTVEMPAPGELIRTHVNRWPIS